MYFIVVCTMLSVLSYTTSDWVSEWMSPVQSQLENPAGRTSNGLGLNPFSDDILRMVPATQNSQEVLYSSIPNSVIRTSRNDLTTADIKTKLEDALQNARALADILKVQINAVASRENTLKEAITNGRSGVSVVTVATIGQPPRSYIVRDNYWTLCNGIIQTPVPNQTNDLFKGLLKAPKCIGQEVTTNRDPCVFNSIIKYETVPTERRLEYLEDDYLCLRDTFNNTLEQYMSVSKHHMNETCGNGTIKKLADNTMECGIRILSEYRFYPQRSSSSAELPLEYCTEKDGSCNLIVAWHISNTTIENFEFFKSDTNFKNYFIKSGPYSEHIVY